MKILYCLKRGFSGAWVTALGMGLAVAAQSQTGALPMLPSEAPTEQSSYAARILNRRGVNDVDPNVYVYNAEFGKRFQMPQEWVSDELKGVDAVAFRVVPFYKSCGWGGNPQACREDEVRCELDLYFDHQRNPLPWDDRMNGVRLDRRRVSADFLGSIANPLAKPKGTLIATYRGPFTHPKTGKEMGWQFYGKGNSFGGWIGLISYDRELFQGVSLVTIGAVCGEAPLELWLASSSLDRHEIDKSPDLWKRIVLPASWQSRVLQAQQASELRSKAFFREQGEKALKALKEAPVPNQAIVPLQ